MQGPLKDKEISDLVSLMSDGMTYVNVHTDKYPDGAIRGQVTSTSASTDAGTGITRLRRLQVPSAGRVLTRLRRLQVPTLVRVLTRLRRLQVPTLVGMTRLTSDAGKVSTRLAVVKAHTLIQMHASYGHKYLPQSILVNIDEL